MHMFDWKMNRILDVPSCHSYTMCLRPLDKAGGCVHLVA